MAEHAAEVSSFRLEGDGCLAMSKRELIAALLMAGSFANPVASRDRGDHIADAISAADALLEALSTTAPGVPRQ